MPHENKRAHYDIRVRNIISSTLTLDEFESINEVKSLKRTPSLKNMKCL